jgi:regulator of protease activity HflC (stomatin/prohibitin superfamily)
MEVIAELIVRFLRIFRIAFITQPWEKAYRVRAGRWDKIYGKGIHARIPFGVDSVKEWDCRTLVVDLQSQSVRTKNNKSLALSGVLRYRVSDVRAASTKVKDLRKSLKNLASAGLAAVVNVLDDEQITLEVLQTNVVKILKEHSAGWGVTIVTFHPIDLSEHRAIRLMSETKDEPEAAVLDLI